MADMKRVLGTMMATGLAGRTARGAQFAHRGAGGMPNAFLGGGGGVKQTAGLAALAYLGYRAYQDYQRNQTSQQPSQQSQRPSSPAGGSRTGPSQGGGLGEMLGGILGGGGRTAGAGSGGAGGGLGDRLADMLRGRGAEPEPEPPPPEETLDDRKALLLVRAMIAAAYADGELTEEERGRIVDALDQAGAGPEEHRIIEGELRNPQPLDAILREARDEETAEQVYLASEIAIRGGSPTETHYLNYLASRLNIPEERRAMLDGMAGGNAPDDPLSRREGPDA